jgi:hypothetical protein
VCRQVLHPTCCVQARQGELALCRPARLARQLPQAQPGGGRKQRPCVRLEGRAKWIGPGQCKLVGTG